MKTKLDWELTIDEFTEEHGSLSPPLFIYLCWNVSEIFRPANPKIIDYLNLEAGKQGHASLSHQNGSKQEQMEAVPRHHCNLTLCGLWGVSTCSISHGRRQNLSERAETFSWFPRNCWSKGEVARSLDLSSEEEEGGLWVGVSPPQEVALSLTLQYPPVSKYPGCAISIWGLAPVNKAEKLLERAQ